jgi:hypothetical protein
MSVNTVLEDVSSSIVSSNVYLFFSQTTEIKLDNKETLYSEKREIEGGVVDATG